MAVTRDPVIINSDKPRRLRTAQEEAEATALRQSFFAKWDGEKFLYGAEAAEYRKVRIGYPAGILAA